MFPLHSTPFPPSEYSWILIHLFGSRKRRCWWMQGRKLLCSIQKPANIWNWISFFLPFILHLNIRFKTSNPFLYIIIYLLKNQQKDKSHYVDVNTYNRSTGQIQSMDQLKQRLATEKGITLIPIPFWWDGTKSRFVLPLLRSFSYPNFFN